MLSKDLIKEQLFESLGYGGREMSRQLGQASFDLLLRLAREFVDLDLPFILESAFRRQDGALLLQVLGARDYLQVYCECEESTCLSRFRERARSGQRHPGHADLDAESDLLAYLEQGLFGPLALPGPLLRLDTNDFSNERHQQGYSAVIRTYGE